MMKRLLAVLLFFGSHSAAQAATYYVAPTGNDANPGTKGRPLQSMQKAQTFVAPGDTVYVRGGTYQMQEAQITAREGIKAYVVLLNKSGAPSKRIHYWAYPGEKPVFDFSQVKPANYRVHAFEITGSWLHLKGLEVTGVQVTITTANTQSICFSNDGGSNNIYEQLSMHDGQGIGFFLTSGSNNLILNCDAYRNYDYISQAGGGRNGGNVDGFGNHPDKGGVGNVFRGCRAWLNSDDGYDCINASEATVFENCWAFYNGYSEGFVSRADGNGFKAGGYGGRPYNLLPATIPHNTIRNCLSVRNKTSGFYSNHHLEGSNWFNNTAYMNGANFNMLNRKARTETEFQTDGPGYNHVLQNNISLAPRTASNDITNYDAARCTIDHNTFLNNSLTVSESDFISLDMSQLTAPRQPDGSLPAIDFLRPKPTSRLIDTGVKVGLPYTGKAPDLGCFEAKK
jgi:hypothetical protein